MFPSLTLDHQSKDYQLWRLQKPYIKFVTPGGPTVRYALRVSIVTAQESHKKKARTEVLNLIDPLIIIELK